MSAKTSLFCVCAFLCAASAMAETRTIHVFVALCDNKHQSIVKVPEALGNGQDPNNNLYWGAQYGVRTWFKKHEDWTLLQSIKNPSEQVLERCIFRHKSGKDYLIADAYDGRAIKEAMSDSLAASGGGLAGSARVTFEGKRWSIPSGGNSSLIAYIGHNGLMDFELPKPKSVVKGKPMIALACFSRRSFTPHLKASGAEPLLWTTNLMAPEAYTLEAAISDWLDKESIFDIHRSAARAYSTYQECTLLGAAELIVSGW